ncbi:unnamed protein product [Trichobilharzia szidati]|nr:unnamed protein product [Trichobilharzia szidati]
MSRPNQLYLPEWLTLRLVSTKYATERTISLLRLYIKYNRLEAACRLAIDMLETAVTEGIDPSLFGLRCTLSKLSSLPHQKGIDNKTPTSGMLYMPHNLFVQILNALNILSSRSETYRTMYENLEITLKHYLLQLQPICHNLMEDSDSIWTAEKRYTQSLVQYQNYV